LSTHNGVDISEHDSCQSQVLPAVTHKCSRLETISSTTNITTATLQYVRLEARLRFLQKSVTLSLIVLSVDSLYVRR